MPAPTRAPTSPAIPAPAAALERIDAQGARRDGGTDDGDDSGQDAEPGEGTQAQAGQGTGQGTRSGVRIMLGACGIRHAFGVSHGDADLVLVEPGLVKLGDGFVGVETILEHADDGRTLLSFHGRITLQSVFQKASATQDSVLILYLLNFNIR